MKPTPRQAGLTLIELMITVLLATILIGGLFYMMAGQQKTYTTQVKALTTQENVWGAMEYLQGQVRKAGMGFGACGGTFNVAAAASDASIPDAGGNGVPMAGIEVYNDINLYDNSDANDHTDSFKIRYVDSSSVDAGALTVRLTEGVHEKSSSIRVRSPANIGIKNGDLVIICDPGTGQPGAMVQITNNPTGGGGDRWTFVHAPGGSVYNPPGGHTHFPPGGFGTNAVMVRYSGAGTDLPHKFAIKKDVNPPLLVTWRAADRSDLQVIAEGIEDMQIAWGCDADTDGIYDEGVCTGGTGNTCFCSTDDCSARQNDEWNSNVQGDTVPTCNNSPVNVVRITLIARTSSPIPGDRLGFRPEAEDHYQGTPNDDMTETGNMGTYGRAVLTSRVRPRNIR